MVENSSSHCDSGRFEGQKEWFTTGNRNKRIFGVEEIAKRIMCSTNESTAEEHGYPHTSALRRPAGRSVQAMAARLHRSATGIP